MFRVLRQHDINIFVNKIGGWVFYSYTQCDWVTVEWQDRLIIDQLDISNHFKPDCCTGYELNTHCAGYLFMHLNK